MPNNHTTSYKHLGKLRTIRSHKQLDGKRVPVYQLVDYWRQVWNDNSKPMARH